MSVHLVRIHSEDPPDYTPSEIDSAVQDWEDSHTEWVNDWVSHKIRRRTSPATDIVWLQGDFRFEASDDKTALLDDAESSLQSYVAWYRLGYHVCDHDESVTQGCSWDDEREYNPNDIPNAVPDFL